MSWFKYNVHVHCNHISDLHYIYYFFLVSSMYHVLPETVFLVSPKLVFIEYLQCCIYCFGLIPENNIG